MKRKQSNLNAPEYSAMDVQTLMKHVIPKNDHEHREGFSNEHIVDQLPKVKIGLVEESLIQMLQQAEVDMLVVETLAYMQSEKSVPFLERLLEYEIAPMRRLITATSIFRINKNAGMVSVAIEAFTNLKGSYQTISGFYFLKRFNNSNTADIIRSYIHDPEYLIRYNALRALENDF